MQIEKQMRLVQADNWSKFMYSEQRIQLLFLMNFIRRNTKTKILAQSGFFWEDKQRWNPFGWKHWKMSTRDEKIMEKNFNFMKKFFNLAWIWARSPAFSKYIISHFILHHVYSTMICAQDFTFFDVRFFSNFYFHNKGYSA